MVKLYVEGGGDSKNGKDLKIACRKGFAEFIDKLKIQNKPRIVACGSRRNAYNFFCTAISNREDAFLLVDSEAPVDGRHQQGPADAWQPWAHLKSRPGDGWIMPHGSTEADCHLMVLVMESWFLADRKSLKEFFKKNFNENALPPPTKPIEDMTKQEIYDALSKATKDNSKGEYGKGKHSFGLLSKINPNDVIDKSPWARRFVDELKKRGS